MRAALSFIATSLFAAGLSFAPAVAADAPGFTVQEPKLSLPDSCKTAANGVDQYECAHALNGQWDGSMVGTLFERFSFMSAPGPLPAACLEIGNLGAQIGQKDEFLRKDTPVRPDYAVLLKNLTHAEAACTNALADTVKDPKEPVNLLRQALTKSLPRCPAP